MTSLKKTSIFLPGEDCYCVDCLVHVFLIYYTIYKCTITENRSGIPKLYALCTDNGCTQRLYIYILRKGKAPPLLSVIERTI